MKTRAFCINCGKYMEYFTRAEDVEVSTPKGKMRCRERSAYCFRCGEQVYVPEINDENVKIKEYAYKNFINEVE